ncbi:MAG: hypothetical protein Q8M94_08735 [Ignavibacteria bacterium]|nr:hypothetical protein [Ignavibacteria bacterium]
MTTIEIMGIGVAVLSPVYAALWYLIILGTNNKNNLNELKNDFAEVKSKFDSCRYCKQGADSN